MEENSLRWVSVLGIRQKVGEREVYASEDYTVQKFHGASCCPHPIGFITRDDGEAFSIPCKRKTCPYCGYVYKRRIFNRIMHGFEGEKVRHVDLSCRIGTPSKFIRESLNRLITYLRTWFGRHEPHKAGFKFFRVFENQQNGTLHIHILINIYIEWSFLVEAWTRATRGEGIHAHIQKPRSAVAYVVKYVNKAINEPMERLRQIAFSRNFPKLHEREPSEHTYTVELFRHYDQDSWLYNAEYLDYQRVAGHAAIAWFESSTDPHIARLRAGILPKREPVVEAEPEVKVKKKPLRRIRVHLRPMVRRRRRRTWPFVMVKHKLFENVALIPRYSMEQ